MRNRLSYYSVALLLGLAVVSAFLLAMNPFGGAPASASPGTPSLASVNASGPPASNATNPSAQTGIVGGIVGQPGGAFEGEHHDYDHGSFVGGQGVRTGNGTVTTSTGSIQSDNE